MKPPKQCSSEDKDNEDSTHVFFFKNSLPAQLCITVKQAKVIATQGVPTFQVYWHKLVQTWGQLIAVDQLNHIEQHNCIAPKHDIMNTKSSPPPSNIIIQKSSWDYKIKLA